MNTINSEREPGEAVAPPSDMVRVPGGDFVMGSDEGEAEGPAHVVAVDEFWMDKTPVTNRDFACFIENTGYVTTATADKRSDWKTYAQPGRERHPVVLVSWHDAQAYALWANKRLPTEAEWEKAARGGLEGRQFPWGDSLPTHETACWDRAHKGGELPTRPVGSYRPNGFGLFDMVGNVWQWCADWYSDDAYGPERRENPRGPLTGTYRVRRGASWNVREAFRLRCANRGAMPPDSYHPNLGFRCVVSPGGSDGKR